MRGRRNRGRLFGAVAAVVCLAASGRCRAAEAAARHPGGVVVIAHRGASLERPEHTLGAYRLAMEQGADYIEPDLCLTADGVLIALHDDSLNRTTDVAERPEFADLCRTNSRGHACWYPGDFTLEQVKRLRTRQSNSRRPAEHNGREPVPTLAEIVALVRAYCRETGRRVGIVPELKQGGRMVEPFLRFVREQSLEDPRTGIPIYLQCFALDTLKACRPRLQSPCAWLFTKWPDRNEWPALKQQIHTFAVHKSLALADDATPRIAEAHAAGFAVLAWTFADDSYDRTRFPTAEAELRGALENGIDGFFTDSPASGVRVRDTFAAARR